MKDRDRYLSQEVIILNNKPTNLNAKKALEQLKMEIGNEFDANLTNEEASDGVTTRDLVKRAERKINDKNTFNPS